MSDVEDNLETKWEKLLDKSRNAESTRAQLYDPDTKVGFFQIVRHPDYMRGLAIEMDGKDTFDYEEYPKWQGIKFDKKMMNLGSGKQYYLSVQSSTRDSFPILTRFCADIAMSISRSKSREQAFNELRHCLSRWKRCFSRRRDGLSPERQQGLFAELWLLETHVMSVMDGSKAVKTWRGKGIHDFQFGSGSLEVKSTRMKEHRTVTINNERQLDNRDISNLLLYVMTLEKVDERKHTLPKVIASLREGLSDLDFSLSEFDNKLTEAGYLDEDVEKYRSTGYSIKKEEIFEVTDDFPKLVDLPPGVGKVKYDIVLASCKSFEIDIKGSMKVITGE